MGTKMSTPKPHANSRQIDAEGSAGLIQKTKILSRLLPNPPAFTVVVSVAFPHDSFDIEEAEDDDEAANIQESFTFCVRAANVHTAIDMALATAADTIREDFGDGDFSLMCCAAFAGHVEDLSSTYNYRKSGAFDEAEAFEGSEVDTYTG